MDESDRLHGSRLRGVQSCHHGVHHEGMVHGEVWARESGIQVENDTVRFLEHETKFESKTSYSPRSECLKICHSGYHRHPKPSSIPLLPPPRRQNPQPLPQTPHPHHIPKRQTHPRLRSPPPPPRTLKPPPPLLPHHPPIHNPPFPPPHLLITLHRSDPMQIPLIHTPGANQQTARLLQYTVRRRFLLIQRWLPGRRRFAVDV